ncbi:MAG: DUF2752 domain-containing protein [Aquihabitans sp.]
MSMVPVAEAPVPVALSTPAWRKPSQIGAAAVAATAAISVLNPVSNHVPLCPFHSLTGLDCPACGGLRAVFSLSRGDIAAAASHHLLFTVAVPFLIVGWALWMVRAFDRPQAAHIVRPRWFGPVALTVLVVFTVARNLPTFAWLGST